MRKTKHEGVFQRGKKIYSKSLTPGRQVYGEKLIGDYREWSVRRSKLGAAIIKGLKNTRIKSGDKVLYLGASSGTTPSHISDIVGKKGAVFCIDIAYRMVRDLVFLCEERENMYPLLENANFPERYSTIFPKVDVVYQDVAVRNQVQILNRNTELFLKSNGYALVSIKARSIDISKNPNEVFKQVKNKLKKNYTILEKINLSPYEKDHMFFVLKKRKIFKQFNRIK